MNRIGILDPSQPINLEHPLNRGLVSWWKVIPQFRSINPFRDLAHRNNIDLTSGTPTSTRRSHLGGWGSLDVSGVQMAAAGASKDIINSSLTMAGWVRFTSHSGYGGCFGFRNDSNCDFFILSLSSSVNMECRFRGSTGSYFDVIATNVVNAWTHMIMTHDMAHGLESRLTVYVDGVAAGSVSTGGAGSIAITSASETFDLAHTNGMQMTGQLDDIRLYNRAFSSADAMQLYLESRVKHSRLLNDIEPAEFNAAGHVSPYYYHHLLAG